MHRLFLSLALLTAGAVQAQGFSAFISPPRFEFQAPAGKTTRQVMEIQHAGRDRGNFRIYTNDWTFAADQSVNFIEELKTDSCRPWVAIERRELVIEPGARYRYRFEITPPAGTPAQECRFALMVEGRDTTTGNIKASGRIGVIVYAAVGNVEPRLELVATRVQTIQGKPTAVIDVRNNGTAHGRLQGFVSGVDAQGRRLELGPTDLPILPGETRAVVLVPLGEGNQPAPTVEFPLRIEGALEWGDRKRLMVDARFTP